MFVVESLSYVGDTEIYVDLSLERLAKPNDLMIDWVLQKQSEKLWATKKPKFEELWFKVQTIWRWLEPGEKMEESFIDFVW